MTYFECRTGDTVRFASVRLEEVEEHARKIFKNENVIAEIYEIEK